MITKEIVQNTINTIEDLMDLANDKLSQEELADIQSLLNFWRLYIQFAPEGGNQ